LTLRGQHRRTVTVRGVRSGRGRRTRQEPSRVAWEPGRPCRLRLDISWRGDCQTAKPPAPGRRRAWTEPRRQAHGAVPPSEPQGSSVGRSQGVGAPHSSVGGRGTCASGTLPSEGGASSRGCRWATGRGLRAPWAVNVTPAGSTAHARPRRDEPDALVGQVRICGRRRGQPRRRPGPLTFL